MTGMSEPTVIVNIRLTRPDGTSRAAGLKERLVEEAATTGLSLASIVQRALAEHYRIPMEVPGRASPIRPSAAPVLNVRVPLMLYRRLALAASAYGAGHSPADELLAVLCARYGLPVAA